MKPARYLVTWAQDATPVEPSFFSALNVYAAHRKAELIVVAGMYRNPTSRHEEQFPDGEWDMATHPFLSDERRELCPNLVLRGDVRIQPTAASPLAGKSVYSAGHSSIFGHAKRALEVVPTATRMPRLLFTTGACTVENYSTTNAGKAGEEHHVLGALVVEIDRRSVYHCRHVTWDRRSKSFTDLDTRYIATGHGPAAPAAGIAFGDIHVGQWSEGGKAERGAKALFDLVQPKHLVVHDVLDFKTRNHHNRSRRATFAGRGKSVRDEVETACRWVRETAAWSNHETHLVRSNHDEALERFVEEFDADKDPENSSYWHWLSWRSMEAYLSTGKWPNLFQMEYERLFPEEPVHWVTRNERLLIGGVDNGFHGDHGVNGSRGSRQGYRKMGVKVNRGHSHTPGWQEGVVDLGVFGALDHGYNTLPSTWLNAHCVTHHDGKRQIIIVIDGCFRA